MSNRVRFTILILTLSLVLIPDTAAQENPQESPGFQIGAILGRNSFYDQNIYDTFAESGMNLICQYANNGTRNFLNNYNLIAKNDSANDWIFFYGTGLYSRWEADKDQPDPDLVGVKHQGGEWAVWLQDTCWSSGQSAPACSLTYGPHYTQEKYYKRSFTEAGAGLISYTAKFRIALDNFGGADPNTEICKLIIRVRHNRFENGSYTTVTDPLSEPLTIKVSEFPDNNFNEFQMEYSYFDYPPHLDESKLVPIDNEGITYSDNQKQNGVEFCVEWLGDHTKSTLYIDNVEVYDNNGWRDYITNPGMVVSRIQMYTQPFNSWPNLQHWYTHDEPSSRDAFIPMHIVDEILEDAGSVPQITHFYAAGEINGESHMEKFVQIAQPSKLCIDAYPFHAAWNSVRWQDLEALRGHFQEASGLQAGFYYTPQVFGRLEDNGTWCTWRRPDSSELKASVMLAVAHGSQGFLFSDYNSFFKL